MSIMKMADPKAPQTVGAFEEELSFFYSQQPSPYHPSSHLQ